MRATLRLFHLRPYSPDRNPDQLVWKHLKADTVGRMAVTGKEDFAKKVRRSMRELQNDSKNFLLFSKAIAQMRRMNMTILTDGVILDAPPASSGEMRRGESRLAATAEQYWPQIDGLRAVAVLSVVAFHAGAPGLSGGYVGVDVFFVISGFLITRLLYRELGETGTIDILDFYARRFRRLAPALTVVLVATLGAGALLLAPIGEQQDLASSALAAAASVSNIFFWRTHTGYFAGPSEQIPLLHMWTLAVEEQFYIVWPIAMLLIGRLVHTRGGSLSIALAATLLAGGAVSFVACWLATPVKTAMAFYLTPFRAWEFAVGGLLALLSANGLAPRAASLLGSALATAGLGAIAASVIWLDMGTVFPGSAALLPVLGAAGVIQGLLLAPGSGPGRLLCAKPLVTVGKLSYSWYLWHWPMLAIARAQALGGRSLARDLGLAGLALLLSALTHWLVETPVRRRKIWPLASSRAVIAGGLLVLTSAAGLAMALWGTANWVAHKIPLSRAIIAAKLEKSPLPENCTHYWTPFTGLAPAEDCTLGDLGASSTIVLWGDSHALHIIPPLATYAKQKGVRLLSRIMGGCKPSIKPIPGSVRASGALASICCDSFNAAMRASLPELKAEGASVVVISARWSAPAPWQDALGPWEARLSDTVAFVRAAGFRVMLVADVPDYTYSVPNCVARKGLEACSRTRADVDADRAAALTKLRRIAAQFEAAYPRLQFKDVTLWDPIDEICQKDRCLAMRHGKFLYIDDNHLSVAGAETLSTAIGKALDPLLDSAVSVDHK